MTLAPEDYIQISIAAVGFIAAAGNLVILFFIYRQTSHLRAQIDQTERAHQIRSRPYLAITGADRDRSGLTVNFANSGTVPAESIQVQSSDTRDYDLPTSLFPNEPGAIHFGEISKVEGKILYGPHADGSSSKAYWTGFSIDSTVDPPTWRNTETGIEEK